MYEDGEHWGEDGKGCQAGQSDAGKDVHGIKNEKSQADDVDGDGKELTEEHALLCSDSRLVLIQHNYVHSCTGGDAGDLSLIHISEPTRP
eukprot:8926788-Ditylum_brightwellii.AAC.1